MHHQKISIITPSFNQAAYLDETIRSVLDQQYPDLEYIVIDGGSTDGSIDVIRKYQQQIAYWESGKDRGQSHAINKGLARATGDIVAWLNSDDLYFPGTLKRVNDLFQANPWADLVYGTGENFWNDGRRQDCFSLPFDPVGFMERVTIPQPAVFWKRNLHGRIGMLDESLHLMMDYELWVRIFYTFKTFRSNERFARLRQHSKAKTANNPKELYLEYRKILSRFISSVSQPWVAGLKALDVYDNPQNVRYNLQYPFKLQELKQILANYQMNCAIQEYTWKHKEKAHRILTQTFGTFPIKSAIYMLKNKFS